MTPDSRAAKRILIVRPSALGDVCRTVPALASLRQAYPAARIDWLVRDAFAPAIAHHPALSSLVLFERRRWRGWLRLARELRGNRYDLVFDLQGLARSGAFAWLTRAPERVGFAWARELAFLGYTHRHRVDDQSHTVDRMLGLLSAHGIAAAPDMRLYLGDEDRCWLERYLDEHGLAGQPYTVLAPTAAWGCKRWPIERFVELSRRLLETGLAGRRIVVVSAPQESRYVLPLAEAFPAGAARLDRRGPGLVFPKTSVGQVMALISRARLVVGNDSAPLHMAVGFNRPLVAVFGPSDPVINGPYGRAECVVQPPDAHEHDLRCFRRHRDDQSLISRVSVEAVWAKVRQQIGQ